MYERGSAHPIAGLAGLFIQNGLMREVEISVQTN